MFGVLDIVNSEEAIGWVDLDNEFQPRAIAIMVNGKQTNHTPEHFVRDDLKKQSINGVGFRFKVSLEFGDSVCVIDAQTSTVLGGGVQCVLRQSQTKPECILVCIMRQEEDYLLEWIAYHKIQGFSLIIGDNSELFDSQQTETLKILAECNEIKLFDLIGRKHAQVSFYDQILALSTSEFKITGFIDCDEFLLSSGKKMKAAETLASHFDNRSVSALALNWACFGSSGQIVKTDGLVIDRFTKRAEKDFAPNRHVKTFVRGARAAQFAGNPHAVSIAEGIYICADYSKVIWDQRGRGISSEVVWNNLRINHYTIKSLNEFKHIKARRGSADSVQNAEAKSSETYFYGYDQNEVDDKLICAWSAEVITEIERLSKLLVRIK